MDKTREHTDLLLVFGFVGALLAAALLFLVLPVRGFSDAENRPLQPKPSLTWSTLWSKRFAADAESFVTDHFPYRNQWVSMKSALELARLQTENNGIYKGKDGYLFEKYAKPDDAKLASYVAAVNRLATADPNANVAFMLVPTSIGVYPDKLPWKAPYYPQSLVNDEIGGMLDGRISYLNGFDFLTKPARGDRPVYYRTDHHWTTYGAYLGYAAYAKRMGWTPLPESAFRVCPATEAFLGSFQTRSRFGGLRPDTIETYVPKQPSRTTAYVADTGATYDSLYAPEFLTKKDKYSFFLGGVHALETIKTELDPAQVDLGKLLVIKDSYAHSMIPFLTRHVPEIHVIDVRYYNGSIRKYMADNGIRDVLLLFNTATFSDNAALTKLGQ